MLTSLPEILTFVDIETTGPNINSDRIFDIALIRVEKNREVKVFSTLLDPATHIPKEISKLTGINIGDLEKAPTFRSIKDEVFELLNGSIFVAHNSKFDYAFLKKEFLNSGIKFYSKQICTLRLSQLLFPDLARHNLDSIIERFKINCESRHRAFSDTKALWNYYKILTEKFDQQKLIEAISFILKKPNLPKKISSKFIDDLPNTHGIYIFYGLQDLPLYVGKSKNIKERVSSHFSSADKSPLEMRIFNEIERIDFETTSGELGASVRESMTIKSLKPLYNKKMRVWKELFVVLKSKKDNYNTVKIKLVREINKEMLPNLLGVFKTRRDAKKHLENLKEKYNLCKKMLVLDVNRTGCFDYKLGKCKGACIGKELFLKYNMRFDMAFSQNKIKKWPFYGPVFIKEDNNNKKEIFAFDNWCFLGSVNAEKENTLSFKKKKPLFDYDIYKILMKIVFTPKKRKYYQINPIENYKEASSFL